MNIPMSLPRVDYTLCYRARSDIENRWTCEHYISSMKELDKKAREIKRRECGFMITMAIPFYSITPMWIRTILLRYSYLPQVKVIND